MDKLLSNKIYFISIVLIVVGFQLVYGLEIILPTNINWIMSAYHDWGQHYLGWAYFRSEPWHLPLGHIDNFNYPAGTNVGYTDSIPLLAIFFKAISFLLPDTFQYLGIWLLTCHLLTGFFTIKILKLFKTKTIYILLAVIIVSFNPVLVYRGMHPALCAHWLILASIYYYLVKPDKHNVTTLNKKQIAIIVLSALINPYLLLMVIGFGFILPFRHFYFDKLITLNKMLLFVITPILLVLISWFVVGMLSFGNEVKMSVQNGYGLYGLNLNSLWNPWGYSPVLPQLKNTAPQQYEGFAYLGLGIFILMVTVFLISITTPIRKNQYKKAYLLPLFIMTVFYVLFAITHQVTYGDKTIISVPIPKIVIEFGSIFRASGRFIWLFYYLLLLFPIILLVKSRLSDKIKIPLLILITVLQIYDTIPLLTCRVLPSGSFESKKISEKTWVSITSNFKRIITVQPFENSMVYSLSYQDLCSVALKNKLPITCGYVARETLEKNKTFKDSLLLDLNDALIKKEDFFITTPNELPNFYNLIYKNKVKVGFLDGFYYLYAKENRIAIRKSNIENKKIDSLINLIERANKLVEIEKPKFVENAIELNLEKNDYNNGTLNLSGWAIRKDAFENSKDSIYLLLTNEKKTFLFKTNAVKRPDITSFKKKGNLDNAGFSLSINTDKLDHEKYLLALAIKDRNRRFTYQLINHIPAFEFKNKTQPQLLDKIPKVTSKGKASGNVEKVEQISNRILISGWAAITKQDSNESTIKLLLRDSKTIYEIETDKELRKDVTNALKDGFNYDDTGFSVKFRVGDIKKGTYEISVYIIDKKNEKAVFFSNKKLIIK